MSMRNFLLLSSALAAASSAAMAQPVSGLYIAGAGGVNGRETQAFYVRDPCGPFAAIGCPRLSPPAGPYGSRTSRGQVGFDAGYSLLGSVGWGLGNGLRLEVEGSYRDNVTDGLHIIGLGTARQGGPSSTYGLITNALFDVNINSPWILPYVGAGVGYAWTDMGNPRRAIGAGGPKGSDLFGNFAYQAMAGASFPLAATPGLALTAEYRFTGMATGASNFYRVPYGAGNFRLGSQNNHAGLIGMRFVFGKTSQPVR